MECKKLVSRLKQAPTIGLLLSGTGAQLRTAGTVAEVTSGVCGPITAPQKLKNMIVGWKPHAEATLENRCPLTVTGLLMLPVLAIAVARLIIDPRLITGAPAWLKPESRGAGAVQPLGEAAPGPSMGPSLNSAARSRTASVCLLNFAASSRHHDQLE